MIRALYILRYAKRHASGGSSVEQQKIKPIALAIIKLRLPECIRQVGGQAGRQAGRQAACRPASS